MILNQDQQDLLNGKYGEGAKLAMKVQVAIGESFGAKRMVPITRAHVALSNQDADLWLAEKLVGLGAKCRISPTVNPGFSLNWFKERDMVDEEDYKMMERTHNAYKKLGASLTYNCTPYIDTNVPNFGEIVAYSESSNTPYANSVWGARTNREGANSALFAAITGYVPEYGLLFDENRKGTILVDVQADMENDYKYHILGMCGKKIGHGVPVFVGLPKHISSEALRNLGAQLNTSGAYDMYHIVGFTPEAPTLEEAFGGKEPERKVVITNEDFAEVLNEISEEGSRNIDFVMFGCPHFTLSECIHINSRLDGRKVKVPMYILTSTSVRETAKEMGIVDDLEKLGAFIIPSTCPDQPVWKFLKDKIGLTESPKCAYYPRRRGIKFVIRDLDTCIEGAVRGEVE
ncbi:MAG: aconitase X catalytic domain-containing protein [Peptoniphilus sp.]|uniref:aconitase X catalytic domain-containing protein n=1 Tax=Peptoniphilus sp. TaxID=1971214 RepID=UPI002A74C419|nr:aconitase X catalytic domain-containing protein [Peptoniphilus sp.]MDY2987838.1 aconitase X catalytic domain-containing protein [Peptoniphilus sp.]